MVYSCNVVLLWFTVVNVVLLWFTVVNVVLLWFTVVNVVLLWFTVVNVVLLWFTGSWDSWFRGWRKEGGCLKMDDCGKMTESWKSMDRPS